MNTSQIVRLNVYECVVKCIEENPEICNNYPGFELSFEFFKSKIFDILEILKSENLMTYDIISKRYETKKKICKAGADIEILLKTISTTDSVLEISSRTKLIYDELYRKKDPLLLNRLLFITENASKNVVSLAKYGITLNLIKEYETMIGNYFYKIMPTKKTVTSKESKLKLKNLFRETEVVLKEGLDKNAKLLKTTHPDFFARYKLMRTLKN